jgi:uncharacterized protein YeaC (DUF1315 family)
VKLQGQRWRRVHHSPERPDDAQIEVQGPWGEVRARMLSTATETGREPEGAASGLADTHGTERAVRLWQTQRNGKLI